VGELASRLAGSSDIYKWTQRGAYASINFVTSHDGFTLNDVVSYEQKHNEANGEGNRDGHDDNIGCNWGVEGPTDDQRILDIRFRQMKNFLATLAFSQGVPMLSHGDEIARTQRGNNNAYCQDNETSWMDWELTDRQRALFQFARKVIAIRQANPVLRRRHFFRGEAGEAGVKDLTWLGPDGSELTEADWRNAGNHVLGMLIHGSATDETDARGRPMEGDTLLLLLNGGNERVRFRLPFHEPGAAWTVLVDTAADEGHAVRGQAVALQGHSVILLRYRHERGLAGDGELGTATEPTSVERALATPWGMGSA
jgi:glycogen operon protein